MPSPDTRYQFVAQAPANFGMDPSKGLRPVVIGFGPCGLFAGLLLAQMGFRPIIPSEAKMYADARRIPGDSGGNASSMKLECPV